MEQGPDSRVRADKCSKQTKSRHHHLCPSPHQPLFCLALFLFLPGFGHNSHSFPRRRLKPSFAAVWARLFGGAWSLNKSQQLWCKHAIVLQSASKLFSAEQLHVSSHGWHHKWTLGVVDGSVRVVYVLNKTDWAQQSNVCEPSFSPDYFHFNVAQLRKVISPAWAPGILTY